MNQDYKNNICNSPNFSLLKAKSKKKKDKKVKKILHQKENRLFKLNRIAKLVEKRDIYKYNYLNCPICKKRNAIDSLLFLNLKEFILYLGYILTFIPQSFEKCNLLFKNQNNIITFFSSKIIEKSLFKKKNPVLICKNCLRNKMNSDDFISTFSPIFGYSINENNNLNFEKKNLSNEEMLLDQRKSINESYVIENNLPTKNVLVKKKEINQLCNSNNSINKSLLTNEYIQFCEDNNIYQFKINHFTIFKNFEECFNSVINCLSNIIFEMRKFKISVHKDIKVFNQLINNEKNKLSYNIKILLIYQDNYSNEISNMITFITSKKNKNYISKLNDIIFIQKETKQIVEEYIYKIYSVIEVLNLYCKF